MGLGRQLLTAYCCVSERQRKRHLLGMGRDASSNAREASIPNDRDSSIAVDLYDEKMSRRLCRVDSLARFA